MTLVNCKVPTCSYFKNNKCYAGIINISGKTAKNEAATCCGSFLNKSVYSNLSEFTSKRGETDEILCNVDTCKHHHRKSCTLNQVEVGGVGNTLIYTETDCTNFEKK